MSATGLPVFDKTLQTTNIWLDDVMAELGPDRQHAWKVLSTVLHKLRDRLTVDAAAHLGAQLPLLIRGVYYDQYTPARQPTDLNLEGLTAEIAKWLSDARPTDPKDALRAVLRTLSRHVGAGEIRHVQDSMPKDVRAFWRGAEEAVVPPAQAKTKAKAKPKTKTAEGA